MFATLWCIFLPGLALLQPWWFEIYRGTTLGGSLLLTAGCAGWLVRRLRPGREMAAEIARSKGAAWQMPTTGWRARFLQRCWRRGERRIEALRPATTDRTGWQRAQRWRVGNTPQPMWIGWTVVLLILIPLFAWAWRHFGDGDTPFPWSFALGFGAAQLTFMGALGTSMAWLPRMSSLPAESLRPGTDRFRRDLALALALDLAPSVLLFATVEALATNLDRQNHVNWAGLPTSFAIFLILGIAAMTALAWVLVARHRWLAVCILVAGAFATVVGVPYLAAGALDRGGVQTGPPDSAVFLTAMQWQLWVPILLAGLIGMLAAARWRTMELAELG